ASRCQSLAQRARSELRGVPLAARADALIGREGRIANDHLDAVERHGELLRHQLLLHRPESLSEIAFAGIRRDGSVLRDRDPRIDLVRGYRGLRLSAQFAYAVSDAEAHNQRARAFQQTAARKPRILQCREGIWSHGCHARTPCAYRTSAF